MISNSYNIITQEYIKSSAKEILRSRKMESHFPVWVIDQAHTQKNNRLVEIDGGATDLLNDNAALLK